jgi:hypothetical protein
MQPVFILSGHLVLHLWPFDFAFRPLDFAKAALFRARRQRRGLIFFRSNPNVPG